MWESPCCILIRTPCTILLALICPRDDGVRELGPDVYLRLTPELQLSNQNRSLPWRGLSLGTPTPSMGVTRSATVRKYGSAPVEHAGLRSRAWPRHRVFASVVYHARWWSCSLSGLPQQSHNPLRLAGGCEEALPELSEGPSSLPLGRHGLLEPPCPLGPPCRPLEPPCPLGAPCRPSSWGTSKLRVPPVPPPVSIPDTCKQDIPLGFSVAGGGPVPFRDSPGSRMAM